MEIKDLSARMGNVDIVLEVAEKGNVREFDKFGKKGKVCNFVCSDATGKVSLTLWNDDIDKISEGDSIQIKNGWVGEYQGELQLSTGKFGELILKEKSIKKSMDTKLETKKTVVKEAEMVKKTVKDDDDMEVYKDEEVVGE